MERRLFPWFCPTRKREASDSCLRGGASAPYSLLDMGQAHIRPRLRILLGSQIALGPGKVELLAALNETGSITAAAKRLDMSYMRAWTLIRTMNACFKEPLVSATHGGPRGGGGAALTPAGRKVLALYRQMDSQCLRAVRPAWKQIQKLLVGGLDS
jgi:molybdate transport system regulatory protein